MALHRWSGLVLISRLSNQMQGSLLFPQLIVKLLQVQLIVQALSNNTIFQDLQKLVSSVALNYVLNISIRLFRQLLLRKSQQVEGANIFPVPQNNEIKDLSKGLLPFDRSQSSKAPPAKKGFVAFWLVSTLNAAATYLSLVSCPTRLSTSQEQRNVA